MPGACGSELQIPSNIDKLSSEEHEPIIVWAKWTIWRYRKYSFKGIFVWVYRTENGFREVLVTRLHIRVSPI